MNFNPLSLYRERLVRFCCVIIIMTFQSTLPIQGETLQLCYNVNSFYYFNPLSLYRERPGAWPGRRTRRHFNPLSLYRERPSCSSYSISYLYISIHSPYTGRDPGFQTSSHTPPHFNPLSLYRERPPGSGTT